MLRRRLPLSSPWHSLSLCLNCASRSHFRLSPLRSFSSNAILESRKNEKSSGSGTEPQGQPESEVKETRAPAKKKRVSKQDVPAKSKRKSDKTNKLVPGLSIKDSLLGVQGKKAPKNSRKPSTEFLQIEILSPRDLDFESVDVPLPPVPMLGYGLDRVLFNPGVYRLQDTRSRVYNFDPYLEKIMPVKEFNFNALEEYKTSSKDESLIDMTKRLDTKFTGSTSSMSGILKHFHYLLSNFRPLNHKMLSRDFPNPSPNFSQITLGPDAVLLRWKDGVYAMDADKAYDSPNIMSWLGNSLEKLLTSDRSEFERYRRSSPEGAPPADISGKCFHYSKLGSILMRSQLDAYDPRLPGSGIFDLKTRAVVSIRMNKNHSEYETGLGYQLRFDNGEWESYEREFYDMTRATLLKYSLQVRMGRMDGIFVAYHNVERLFGFQYLSKQDMDDVLHGQQDTCLGDQEFKLSISLLEELMKRAAAHFPNTSLRLHVEARKTPFLYFFAEPVTEEQAEEIQNSSHQLQKEFERNIVGVQRDDAEVQAAFHDIQGRVNEQFDEDETKTLAEEVDEEQGEDEKGTESDDDFRGGPLMGWTLTVRSQVNGRYVTRPQNLEPEDDWTIEYHIKEIAPEARWGLYNRLKERRRKLISLEARENMRGMSFYDNLIQKYTDKGREWRATQDKFDEEIGQKVYKRLGPGSDATS